MLISFFHVAFYDWNVTVAEHRGVAIDYALRAQHLKIIN